MFCDENAANLVNFAAQNTIIKIGLTLGIFAFLLRLMCRVIETKLEKKSDVRM